MAWSAGQILTAANLNTYLPQTSTTWASPFNSGLTVGNGTTTASYARIGATMTASLKFTFGSTSAVTADIVLNLPVAATESWTVGGSCWLIDISASNVHLATLVNDTAARCIIRASNASGTYIDDASLSSTVPWTWATGDFISVQLLYLVA